MNIAVEIKPSKWLQQIQIRAVAAVDLHSLEWEGSYVHFRQVYAAAFKRSERGQAALWVAKDLAGLQVGQIFVMLKSDFDFEIADGRERAFIHSFRVRPEHRGRGLGSYMLAFAEEDLRRRGFSIVSLNVANDNPGALRLYERNEYRRAFPVSGDWSYIDHLGQERHVHEPGWRMVKNL